MKQYRTYLLALAVTLMSGLSLSAATSTWDGDTDSFWTTALNWDTAPAGGKDIVFPSVANQTVDLAGGTYNIATLTFNSPNAYSLGNGGLTLGGDLSQNGAGAVTLNVGVDLGGVSRGFGGSGSGVVTFNNRVTGDGFDANLNAGDYVIANNANTINRWVINTGAKATIVGSGAVEFFNNPSYFGGNGGASFGGFYIKLDGGTLDFQATETSNTVGPWGNNSVTATMGCDWKDRSIIFGPNGGTLLWTNAAPGGGPDSGNGTRNGPSIYYSQGGKGTIVIGQPLPWSGDPWDALTGTNNWRSPFEVEYGFSLGIFQNGSLHVASSDPYLKWRQGWGDIEVVLTNGASAYLDWNAMTNGNLIISGQPGGDSSVIETNATGWTRNVGRLAIRGPHRNGIQYSDATLCPPGTITRSFYMDQPNGMKFQGAVQVWNRDGLERLACDMSFEAGSSVDFCGGGRINGLDLGHCGNAAISQDGPTNTMTIKSGGKCNLNLQLRSQYGDSRRTPYGESAGLRVWSFIDIKDGGELKIYRSQTNAMGRSATGSGGVMTKCIELFRPVIGNGSTASDSRFVVDLPWSPKSNGSKDTGGNGGDNGVNFEANPNSMGGSYPGALPIVNGSGDYGLRIVGKGSYVTNYLEATRSGVNLNALAGLTGSGGTLTIALTDTLTIDIRKGPGAASSVKLGLDTEDGSVPTYILGTDASMVNFAGLVLKGSTARVNDASTVTMQTLRLAGVDAAIQLGGNGGSGSVLNFANSSAVAWNAGTLSIVGWGGSFSGGGSDQIKFGTDTTGLTVAQLAQVKWIAPNGGADVTGASILANGEIVPLTVVTPPVIGAPAVMGGNLVFNVVAGTPSQVGVVECATNLTPPVTWVNVVTNTGNFGFTNNINVPKAFYRVRVQ